MNEPAGPNPLTALAGLPRGGNAWELGVVRIPIAIGAAEIHGAVFVIETGTARIRVLQPLLERTPALLIDVLRQAIAAPGGDFVPERPLRILVEDKDLLAELRLPLSGAGIPLVVVDVLPSKESAAEALRAAILNRQEGGPKP